MNAARIQAHLNREPYRDILGPLTEEEWRSIHKQCFICRFAEKVRKWPFELQLHHICRRSQATKERVNVTENYFAACNFHHSGALATMKPAMQLAFKILADGNCGWASRDGYLDHWLRISDPTLKAPFRVTLGEINIATDEICGVRLKNPGIGL